MSGVLPMSGRGILKPGFPQTQLPANFAVPNGLIVYWPFDTDCMGSTTAFDISGNNNHTTIQGSPLPTLKQGQVDTGLAFNGTSNFAQTPINLSAISGTVPVSISLWANLGAIPTGFHALVQVGVTSSALAGFAIGTGPDGAGSVGIFYYGGRRAMTAAAAVTTGVWYHFVGSYSGSGDFTTNTKFYINAGPQILNNTSSGTPNFTAGPAYVGEDAAAELAPACTLDDIRIYNRALDPWEVIQLYQAGLAGRRDAGQNMPQWTEMGAA